MKNKKIMLWFCCVVLLFCGASAVAQTITASVRGTVTDPSGAVVAGANVTATNVATDVATHTVTDHSGLYNIQFLNIGNYTITVSAPGFNTVSIGPFHLQIDQIAKMNAKLAVGTATTTVKVASTSPLLNAENSTIGTSISSQTLENMPLNGLNVQFSTLFVPGSTNPNVSYMSGTMATERDSYQNYAEPADDQPSFNGNRQQANGYILDGIDINETLNNSLGYNPSPFSIQETRIITGNADAEYGNVSGGEVLMVTKSGTNQFHGSAFEYHEASGLTANSWSNNFNHVTRTNFSQNQFGGAVGGPIFKNKLFFFANYIGFRYDIPTSEKVTSVPTQAERGLAPGGTPGVSDMSAVLQTEGIQLYDTSNGYANATPYVNNQVPIVNPVAKFLFAHPEVYPLPNNTPTAGTVTGSNYIGKQASNTYNNQGDVRVDFTATPKDTFMFKYTNGDAYDLQTQTVIPVIFPSGNDYPTTSGVAEWIHTFSPSIVNEFRAGYTRILLNQGTTSDPSGVFGKNGDAVVGIPLKNQAIDGFTFMSLNTGDMNNFGVANYIGTYNLDNNFDYSDDLTWEHGNHITKFGVQFIRYQENYFAPGNLGGQLGNFSYSSAYTSNPGISSGYGFASFLLDKGSSVQIAGVTGPFGQRQWRNAFYVQDDWKILPNLTLNLGLRYAYNQPIYEVNNKQVNVNLPKALFAPLGTPVQSLLNYAGQNGNSRALYNPYRLGFMPRFGFALQVNPRTVLRGGYGITDDEESTGTGLRMTQNPPFQPQFSQGAQVPTATSGGTWFAAENGFASLPNTNVAGAQFDAWDPNFRPSVVQQFNLTAQYLIDNHTSVQLGYVGQLGQHLAVPLWLNQYTEAPPNPCDAACYQAIVPYDALVGVGGIVIETTSRGVSNYNALQATLQHQQTRGLEFSLNYTWGKSMTNNPGYYGVDGADNSDSFWQDVHNPQAEYGPTTFDAHNIFSGIMVYQLPLGHDKQYGANWNRLTDWALGGWELSGDAQLHTGYPVTVATGNPTCANNCGAFADYVEHANQYFPMRIVHRSVAHWFGTDPSATPCASPGQTTNSLGAPCAYGSPLPTEYGSAHVGTERAPGYRDIDLSLFKGFRTVGDQVFKIRVDAFNAFNIASYGFPNRSIDNPGTFGKITGTSSPARQIQLSAIYQF